jgi:cytochrome c
MDSAAVVLPRIFIHAIHAIHSPFDAMTGDIMNKFATPLAAIAFLTLAAGPALADGDAAKGQQDFKVCGACHTVEAGKNRVGPSLHDLFGRKAGTAAGYSYSKDMKDAGEKGLVWGEDTIFEYLADPAAFLRKYLNRSSVTNKMVNKFAKKDFREDVIAYLKQATK